MQKIIQIDLGGVNAYLISHNGNFVLVDTGGPMFLDKIENDRKEILFEKLKEYGVDQNNLKLLILTHGDIDHSYNVDAIKEYYQVPFAMGEEDLFLVHNPKPDAYLVNLKYRIPAFRIIMKLLSRKIEALMKKWYGKYQSVQPDFYLKEGQTLEEYGIEAEIFKVGGHTPGSIVISTPTGTIIGDILVNQKKPELAVNAMDFHQLKNGVKEIETKCHLPYYPGHGRVIEKMV